jgi:hypothetical protein
MAVRRLSPLSRHSKRYSGVNPKFCSSRLKRKRRKNGSITGKQPRVRRDYATFDPWITLAGGAEALPGLYA